MQSAEVLLAQSHPTLFALSRPQVTGQTAHKALPAIVYLDELLATLIAVPGHLLHFRIVFSRYWSTVSPPRMAVSCSSV
jgi:hypothetical protein